MAKPHFSIRLQLVLALCISAIFLPGCAQNVLNYAWTDSEYHGPVQGPILVIGVFKDPTVRKIYEDSFVTGLQSAGVTAIPSHQFDLQTTEPTTEDIRQIVKQAGASAVLITHLLSEDTKSFEFLSTRYAVGGAMISSAFYGYHSTIYGATFGGSETIDKTTDRMAAVLFEVQSEKLIWSAHSKSVNLNNMLRTDDEKLEAIFITDMKTHNIL
ncbi:MAG: hypothetical protein ACI8PB_003057 [Desulforhopalus sp.]|jgi:hypothetical protein